MVEPITEVLKRINDNPGLLYTEFAKGPGDGGVLGALFRHSFMPGWKIPMPAGDPPYKVSAEPIGMTPSSMFVQLSRMPLLIQKGLTTAKREQIFIQMLESMHSSEAKLLLVIKDQNLPSLYPNITAKVVADAGFIPQSEFVPTPTVEVVPVVEGPPKPRRGRPPKNETASLGA